MQQFLNFISTILTNPIAYFIIIAMIGGLGRFAAWVKDQRVKRAAAQERARLRAEALRTGKLVDENAPDPEATPTQSAVAERQARLRAMQEQRAAQLRELQQRRLAELRAKRAAQAQSTGQPQQQPQSQPRRPARTTTQRQAPQQQPRPTRAQSGQEPRVRVPTPTPIDQIQTHSTPSTRPIKASAARAEARAEIDAPVVPAAAMAPAVSSARQRLFGSREDLRRSVIAAEVLGPPLAIRDDDQRSI